MKIVDCFTFYNELDLLNYRLNILNEFVDYFVLVESTHTHIGKEKKLYFSENKKNLFEKFKDKMIHVVVSDILYKYPNINYNNDEQWENEKYQRNCIDLGIQELSLEDDDIIIISDLDEIPNPNILKRIKNNEIPITINALNMDFYYYNLNSKITDMQWNSSKILLYKYFNELKIKNFTCNMIRVNHSICLNPNQYIIKNGGWHLSYFGDAHFIKNKLENFAHQEYNNDEYTNLEKIEKRITSGIDLLEKEESQYNHKIIKIPIKENLNLPPEYESYLQKFILF
jgi:beta-1,4-mannosyl-glycoprotein beta-1,4-N-acetylglucosaminyltransferase